MLSVRAHIITAGAVFFGCFFFAVDLFDWVGKYWGQGPSYKFLCIVGAATIVCIPMYLFDRYVPAECPKCGGKMYGCGDCYRWRKKCKGCGYTYSA